MVKKSSKLKRSTLEVFDIPLGLLVGDDMNPNEMDQDKFDMLIEEIRENGFDEPIQVIPHPKKKGKYLIAGGHWRTRAATELKMKAVPAVIKDTWTEDQQKFALVKRNIMSGKINGQKFTQLYGELSKKYNAEILKTHLGFTEKKEFDSVYEGIESSLNPKQKVQLKKAKETIKSVDDLSSVLNTIFKEQGSEVDSGYVVFSFGGKNHHYIQIDDDTDKVLTNIHSHCENTGASTQELLASILSEYTLKNGIKAVKRKKKSNKTRRKRKRNAKEG